MVTGSNWSVVGAPLLLEATFRIIPSGTTVNANAGGFANAVIGGSVSDSGGSLTLSGSAIESKLEKLTLEAATLRLAGSLKVTGSFLAGYNSTVDGGGELSLEAGSEDAIDAYLYNYSASCTDLSLGGETTLTNNSNLGFSNVGAGSGSWGEGEDGSVVIASGSRIVNHGTFLINPINRSGYGCSNSNPHGNGFVLQGGGELVNTGTIAKTADTGTTIVDVPVVNSGTVKTETGTFSFAGNVNSSTGSWQAASGTTIEPASAGSAATFSGGSLSGAGSYVLGGSAFTVSRGTVLPVESALTVYGGAMHVIGTLKITGSFSIGDSAHLNGGGELSLESSSREDSFNATMYNYSESCIDLYVQGQTTLTNNSTLGLANINSGGWGRGADGGITLSSGSRLLNHGVLELNTENMEGCNSGGSVPYGPVISGLGTIVNSGTIAKTAGTGEGLITSSFENSGNVHSSTGSLSFYGGGSSTNGTWLSAETATVGFGDGSFTSNGDTWASGSNFVLNSGKLTVTNNSGSGDALSAGGGGVVEVLHGGLNLASLSLEAARLNVGTNVNVSHSFTAGYSSVLEGGGNLAPSSGVTAQINSYSYQCPSFSIAGSSTLNNAGNISFYNFHNEGETGAIEIDSGSRLLNSGVINLNAENISGNGCGESSGHERGNPYSNGALRGAGTVTNTGTLQK